MVRRQTDFFLKMKNLLFAVLASSFLLLSCSKSDMAPALPTDPGCSEISLIPVSAHSLSSAEVLTVNSLFSRNNIDNRNFRYTRYSHESVQTFFPPFASFDSQLVVVEEYTNGLRILNGQSNFIFKNGLFDFRVGHQTSGTSLDTSPTRRAGQLRALFLATITQFDTGRSEAIQQQCMHAEFGYYDLNAGTSDAPEKLVKAWRVTPKNQDYPFAYYQDEAGQLIYYDNGIRTFR